MGKLQRMTLALASVGCLAFAPGVHAIPFNITAAAFTPGTGYGTDADADEKDGTLLGVNFSTSGFTVQDFSLNTVGGSYTFDFGSVTMNESNAHGGIGAAETDSLDVTASFTFVDPIGSIQKVLATGTAFVTTGSVSDIAVDFILDWNTLSVSFGSGGLFDIDLGDLSFTGNGSQTQTATITLRQLPEPISLISDQIAPLAIESVPEPGVVPLLSLGLLGLVMARRTIPA